jgi:hypothetical protein
VLGKITQPSKDYKEKLAALQDIQNNPHTAYDQELKKKLTARLDQLKTTSESLKTDNPCWKGYKPVGTKEKNGKTVPNCVPK